MQWPASGSLRIGDWRFDPGSGDLSRNEESIRLEVRTARLLTCLAERPGEVVSIDELLDRAWAGVTVSQDSVYQAVTSLRRVLGDDSREPKYIETVPRMGYRLVARVDPRMDPSVGSTGSLETASNEAHAAPAANQAGISGRFGAGFAWAAGAIVCLLLGIGARAFLLHRGAEADPVRAPQASIAVLPFLDLTEGMKNEEFADGITEELIDKLSKVPGLRVSSATASFYFKGKQVPVGEIARSLGIAYVLDGSLRKSGIWVRVDARLVRAENGFVAWSATYDQPMSDILTIQDDIANKVTKALKGSIGADSQGDVAR